MARQHIACLNHHTSQNCKSQGPYHSGSYLRLISAGRTEEEIIKLGRLLGMFHVAAIGGLPEKTKASGYTQTPKIPDSCTEEQVAIPVSLGMRKME